MTIKDQALELIKSFSGQANTLTIPRPYIAMTGSLEAALLLSQIVYWTDRSTMKDGWFAKSYPEWESELTLSQYQVTKAVKALKEFGVETKLKKFKDAPTLHYRVNQATFLDRIMKFFDNPGIVKKVDNPLTEPTEPTNTLASDDAAQSNSEPQTETPSTVKPKQPRQPNPIFDAVALGSFQLTQVNGDKTLGARIGKIVAWLKGQEDVTAERVAQFYAWYEQQNQRASAPRDVGKFAEWWAKFAAAGAGEDDPFAEMDNEAIVGGRPW